MRLRLGDIEHDLTTRTMVMGMLVGPSSASLNDGSSFDDLLHRADRLVGEGADILDVGGAHAGPGSVIGEDEEMARLVPTVAALRARFDVALAVDTSRAGVLAESCAAGAVIGNDLSGFADSSYLPTAAGAGATVVATHTRLKPGSDDLVGDVRAFLGDRAARARAAGIPEERIIVDAGLDHGKSTGQAVTLLRESAALADLGSPLMLSASNKCFLGMLLGLEIDERRMASHAAHALGIARGCRIVRVHDVRGARRVADILEALLAARLAQVGRGWAAEDDDDV